MKFKVLLVLVGFALFSCDKNDNVDYPDCLQESIDSALNREPTSPRSYIKKWMFEQQVAYQINMPQGYADGMTTIVSENCELTCSIGGIGGLVCDGFDQAEMIETVWEDPR